MQEIRCLKCNKLLLKTDGNGSIEVKCPRCGTLNMRGVPDILYANGKTRKTREEAESDFKELLAAVCEKYPQAKEIKRKVIEPYDREGYVAQMWFNK